MLLWFDYFLIDLISNNIPKCKVIFKFKLSSLSLGRNSIAFWLAHSFLRLLLWLLHSFSLPLDRSVALFVVLSHFYYFRCICNSNGHCSWRTTNCWNAIANVRFLCESARAREWVRLRRMRFGNINLNRKLKRLSLNVINNLRKRAGSPD